MRRLAANDPDQMAMNTLALQSGEDGGARTAAAEVYGRLRVDILSCKLTPGSRLRFEDLKEAYGVGISPLREALSRLVASGLVTTEGQRGFRVAPASEADITDIAMVRKEIEGLALRMAVGKGDDAWEANLVAARHKLALLERRNAKEEVNEEEWEARHRNFHLALIQGCGSPWLVHLAELLFDQFDRYRRMSVKHSLSGEPTSLEHQRIMQAALDRNADGAVGMLHDHIDQALSLILSTGISTPA